MTLKEARKLAESPPASIHWSDYPSRTRSKVETAMSLLELHIKHLEEKRNK